MLIDYKTGIRREVVESIGNVLVSRKIARPVYSTRDMVAAPVRSIDDMSAEELHALAKSRGIKVHHRAGADKVRAAIWAAQ